MNSINDSCSKLTTISKALSQRIHSYVFSNFEIPFTCVKMSLNVFLFRTYKTSIEMQDRAKNDMLLLVEINGGKIVIGSTMLLHPTVHVHRFYSVVISH